MIQNGTIWIGNGDICKSCDIIIKNGKIMEVGKNLPSIF